MPDFGEKYPSQLLQEAVESIKMLPGVGRRSALRLALYLLRQDPVKVHHFTDSIARLRDEARYCRECKMLSDGEVCSICSDHSRDHSLICVVESIRDVTYRKFDRPIFPCASTWILLKNGTATNTERSGANAGFS